MMKANLSELTAIFSSLWCADDDQQLCLMLLLTWLSLQVWHCGS